MDVKIKINARNRDKVLELIRHLIETDSEGEIVIAPERAGNSLEKNQNERQDPPVIDSNLLKPCETKLQSLGAAHIRKSGVGAWGMFNSILPGKAALRILANTTKDNNGKQIAFNSFIKTCIAVFKAQNLSAFRGFPKDKVSSASRTEWHLIRPLAGMGLLEIKDGDVETIAITKEGLEFCNIPNPVLDGSYHGSVLSEKEQKWMVEYLKEIDKKGYEEYSILREFFYFIKKDKRRYEDLKAWFSTNKRMLEDLKDWSRKKDDAKAFEKQIGNVSGTFVTGKLALLRELGFVSSKRNDYTTLKDFA